MNTKRTTRSGAEPLARLEAAGRGWQVIGDVNFSSVPVLLSQARNLLKFCCDLNIDMAKVDHADSAGLALLLEWMDISRANGGAIRFRNVPESLLNIARVSNVYRLLPLD